MITVPISLIEGEVSSRECWAEVHVVDRTSRS